MSGEVIWPTVRFDESLVKKSGKTVRKLQTASYRKVGAIPIVDQGAPLIGGYTDDTAFMYPHDLPVVIFGDHTRMLKYVDFPFAIGADGTQCLHPNDRFDPQFFFYALSALNLPSEGYARHFKLLKEKQIPAPSLDEQRRIAEVLRSVDEAIQLTEQASLAARFTFNRIIDELQTIYEYSLVPLSYFCMPKGLQTGPFGSQLKVADYVDTGIPVIMPTDLKSDGIDFIGAKSTSLEKANQLPQHHLRAGDILFSRRGDVEKCGLYMEGDPAALCGTGCLRARVDPSKADPVLIYFLVQSEKSRNWLKKHAVGVTMPNLNTSIIGALPVPNFPMVEQKKWVEVLLLAEGVCRVNELHLTRLSSLKRALAYDLLSGRVRVPT